MRGVQEKGQIKIDQDNPALYLVSLVSLLDIGNFGGPSMPAVVAMTAYSRSLVGGKAAQPPRAMHTATSRSSIIPVT